MFFSKVVLFAISLGAISVLATPHALHHHALHRRAVAARVASIHSNSSDVTVKRQTSPKCNHRSTPPSSAPPSAPSSSPSSAPSSTVPAVTAVAKIPKSKPSPATTPTPSPTSTPQQQPPPPPPPSTTPAATPPPSTGGNNGPFSGDGTFYAAGLGACGITNTDADHIVAVSQIRFDAASTGPNPNSNPLCGKKVSISFGGQTSTATIVDRCTGCAKDSLDMTPNLFQVFALLDVGRIHNIQWNFIS